MKIRNIKSAITRMFKNEAIYFHDGIVSGQIETLSICDGAKYYTVELKDGRKRGRMAIDGTMYLFTDKNDFYK